MSQAVAPSTTATPVSTTNSYPPISNPIAGSSSSAVTTKSAAVDDSFEEGEATPLDESDSENLAVGVDRPNTSRKRGGSGGVEGAVQYVPRLPIHLIPSRSANSVIGANSSEAPGPTTQNDEKFDISEKKSALDTKFYSHDDDSDEEVDDDEDNAEEEADDDRIPTPTQTDSVLNNSAMLSRDSPTNAPSLTKQKEPQLRVTRNPFLSENEQPNDVKLTNGSSGGENPTKAKGDSNT